MPVMLITGANRGIGLAVARVALARGWTVLGSMRREEDADRLATELGPLFRPQLFDVADRDALAASAASSPQAIDVLLNNAGIIGPDGQDQSALHMDFGGFLRTLEINTLAPLAVAQAFLPRLRKAAQPRILTISSQMSWMAMPSPTGSPTGRQRQR